MKQITYIFLEVESLTLNKNLAQQVFFHWIKLKPSVPLKQIQVMHENSEIGGKNICLDYHLIKGARMSLINKINSMEVNTIVIFKCNTKTTWNLLLRTYYVLYNVLESAFCSSNIFPDSLQVFGFIGRAFV